MLQQRQPSYLIHRSTGKRIKIGGCRRSQTLPPKATKYAASRYQEAELPHKVDLRPYMTQVEDQSAVNSCSANAIAGAYEYLAKRTLGASGDVSRLFIYYNGRALLGDENKDEGSSITACIQALQEMGACTEDTWPYDVMRVNAQPHNDAFEEALQFLIEEAEEVKVDLFAMKHCLAEGYPFVFGLALFKSFDKAGKNGKVPMPDPNSEEGRQSHGAHAMLCVGYSDKSQAFIVRNSWGEDWGHKGYCYIPYAYMTNPEYCWDCWKIASVSDLDFTAGVWYEDDENYYEEDDEDYEDSYYEYYYEEDEDGDVEDSYEEETVGAYEDESEEDSEDYDEESDEEDSEDYDEESDEEDSEDYDEESDEEDSEDYDEESDEEDSEDYDEESDEEDSEDYDEESDEEE
jgi:C1A family cysteine protease